MRRRAALLLAIAFGGLAACGGGPDVDPSEIAASCGPVLTHPEAGRNHVPTDQDVRYEQDPPTSGDHWEIPAPTGYYTDVLPRSEQIVHNLEHGHIVMYVMPGTLPEDVLRGVTDLVKKYPRRVLLIAAKKPIGRLDTKLLVTAWGHSRRCQGKGPEIVVAAERFIKQFVGKGPEGDIPGQPQS